MMVSNWKTLVAVVLLAPVIALFGGAGFLFYQIGQTWDARSTDSLIAGLVATCGGGAVVIGLLLAIIIGVPFAIRSFGESGYAVRRGWHERVTALPTSPSRLPRWRDQPPQIQDHQHGSWRAEGVTYDTWEDDDNITQGAHTHRQLGMPFSDRWLRSYINCLDFRQRIFFNEHIP